MDRFKGTLSEWFRLCHQRNEGFIWNSSQLLWSVSSAFCKGPLCLLPWICFLTVTVCPERQQRELLKEGKGKEGTRQSEWKMESTPEMGPWKLWKGDSHGWFADTTVNISRVLTACGLLCTSSSCGRRNLVPYCLGCSHSQDDMYCFIYYRKMGAHELLELNPPLQSALHWLSNVDSRLDCLTQSRTKSSASGPVPSEMLEKRPLGLPRGMVLL